MKTNLIEIIERKGNLYDVNVDEAWKKLATSQFADEPGRAFGELVANAIDSYPQNTPFDKIKIDCTFSDGSVTITDWGEGMSLERINCLITIGGSDKSYGDWHIGQFGIGFCSMFNPALQTRVVKVTTRCENQNVDLTFNVIKYEKPPEISARVISEKINFSTRIEIVFNRKSSVHDCKKWIDSHASYYPYNISINSHRADSIWNKSGSYYFENNKIKGRIYESTFEWINVLSKFCYVISTTIGNIQSNSNDFSSTLKDYTKFPYIPHISIDVNCDSLNLVMSRNSFYLDYSYTNMCNSLKDELCKYLVNALNSYKNFERMKLIITNQYIFRNALKDLIKLNSEKNYKYESNNLVHLLFEEKVYSIEGKKGNYSIKEIFEMKDKELPLFFCKYMHGINWMNRKYKHDFIIKVPESFVYYEFDSFYHDLFNALTDSLVVNLDTIHKDNNIIKKLVEQDIINPKEFSKKLSIKAKSQFDQSEVRFLDEMNKWINQPDVLNAIRKNIKFAVNNISVGLFTTEKTDSTIMAALFKENRELLFEKIEDLLKLEEMDKIYIGINVSNSLIINLKESGEKNKTIYLLGIIARELAFTQKLIPFSSKFYYVQRQLERDMITALQKIL